MRIRYLNTDLDLVSADDIEPLTAELQAKGVTPLSLLLGRDGRWYSCLEVDEEFTDEREPENHIAAMLDAIESLPERLHSAWRNCTVREFCIGYDCGDEPRAFQQGLSTTTLRRMSEVGATLRITIYPERYSEGDQEHERSVDQK